DEHEGAMPAIVVQLRPTTPLRPPGCVDEAITLLRSDPTADSVRGVVLSPQNPYKMWRVQANGALAPLLDDAGPEAFNRPRQQLPMTYWQTGHIDSVWTRTIVEQESMSGTRILPLILDGAYTCDIDTETDWQRTEWMLMHLDRPVVRPNVSSARHD